VQPLTKKKRKEKKRKEAKLSKQKTFLFSRIFTFMEKTTYGNIFETPNSVHAVS
jgi:hypothetical protein